MVVSITVLILLLLLIYPSEAAWGSILNTTELIAREGYKSENHTVESQDGFRVSVFRIPGSGPPVYLMHGLFVASDSWVLRGKDHDLVYLLADQGYDVWLGDVRGNCYSRSHNTFSPEDSVFWDFSVEEMGSYDLPAVIDYILDKTGHSSLVYIGHSLGTTMMYVMSSRRPEYVYKVKLMVGLAPAAFFGRYRAGFQRLFLESASSYSGYIGRAGVHEVLPRHPVVGVLARTFCSADSPTINLCQQFIYFAAGLASITDFSHINKDVAQLSEMLPNLVANTEVANPLFNHMDFIWAEDARALVYEQILQFIAKYTK